MWRAGLTMAAAVVALGAGTGQAQATSDCRFRRDFRDFHSWTLRGDCFTDETLVIPVASLDGRGFTITARDPAGGHFTGAILRNGGDTLHVRNVRLTAEGLADVCDGEGDRLRGVLLEGASGSVTDSVIADVRQGDSGCQEGSGIEARNLDGGAGEVRVRIADNRITGYQKTGILVNGDIDAEVVDNVVDGGAPVGFIARNGVQIGFGARGRVRHNRISGNSYTGTSTVGAGVLVVGGPFHGGAFTVRVDVLDNVILGADVGVFLDNSEADGGPSLRPTRIEVEGNFIRHDEVTNGVPYSAGVTDIGNRDRIVGNRIVGAAYDPATLPGATFEIDVSLAVDPRLRDNR